MMSVAWNAQSSLNSLTYKFTKALWTSNTGLIASCICQRFLVVYSCCRLFLLIQKVHKWAEHWNKKKKRRKNTGINVSLTNALQLQTCLKSVHFIQMVFKRENIHIVAPQPARAVDTWQDGSTFMTNSCPAIWMMRHKKGFMRPDGMFSPLNHPLLALKCLLWSSSCC